MTGGWIRRAGPRTRVTRLAAMPGAIRKSLLVCVFALALALAGCGSDDEGTIPPSDAENLLNQLAAVQSAVSEGDCDFAQEHAEEFAGAVEALPNDVEPKVAEELSKAAGNLETLAADPDQCTETGASGEDGVEPTTPTETAPEETSTTSTTSTTSSTTDEETTTNEPSGEQPSEAPGQEPPSGNQGQGGGTGGGEPPTGGVTGGGNAG
jgi:hypothetical protein